MRHLKLNSDGITTPCYLTRITRPFTSCLVTINNTFADNAKHLDVVMPMYNLLKYSDNYSRTLGSLGSCYTDKIMDIDDDISNTKSFKYKNITRKAPGRPPRPENPGDVDRQS